jgi:hypothetical protein
MAKSRWPQEMLGNIVLHQQLPFHAALMDTWYATKDVMLDIESLQKVSYCPVKGNRQADDSGGLRPDQRVDALDWNTQEGMIGKRIKLKGFPKDHHVQSFRVGASTRRTDGIVMIRLLTPRTPRNRGVPCAGRSSNGTTKASNSLAWKVAKAAKRVCGAIISPVPSWSGCAVRRLLAKPGQTVYRLNHRLLDDYLVQQLKHPSLTMVLA